MSNPTTHDPATAADALCVQRCLAGDPTAYTPLVERHLPLVYSIVLARSRYHEPVAEELAQEVFLRAWLQLHRLSSADRFGAWVARIARNLATDWHRKSKRQSSIVKLIPLDQTEVLEMPAEDLSPHEYAQRTESLTQVRSALKQLPLETQELLLLHYAEGLSQSDIARHLRVHPSTILRKLDRAVAQLREKFHLAPETLAGATAGATTAPTPPPSTGDGSAVSTAHNRQRLARATLAIIAAASALPQAQRASLASLAEQSWPTPPQPTFTIQQFSMGGRIMTYAGAAAIVVAGVAGLTLWWQPGASNAEAITPEPPTPRASQTVVTAMADDKAAERIAAHQRRVAEAVRKASDKKSTSTATRATRDAGAKPLNPHVEAGLKDGTLMEVKGRVVDDYGQPVEEVQVYLSMITLREINPNLANSSFPGSAMVSFATPTMHAGLSHTDEMGVFTTTISTSFTQAVIYTDHPPYVRTQELVDLPAENITIKLSKDGGATVRGRVVINDSGSTRGVSHARVQARIDSSHVVEWADASEKTRKLHYSAGNVRTQTNDDGYFEIDRMAVGTSFQPLSVQAKEGVLWPYSFPVAADSKIVEAKNLEIPDIQLFTGYTVRGVVRDSQSKEPLEGVIFSEGVPGRGANTKSIVSDADGRFEVPNMEPLPFTQEGLILPQITMWKDGYATSPLMIEIPQPYSLDNTVIEHDAKLSKMTPELEAHRGRVRQLIPR